MTAQQIPLKIYKGSTNGTPFYQVLPGYNTPWGFQETTLEDLMQNASDVNKSQILGDINASFSGGNHYTTISDAVNSGSSGYVNDNGTFTTQKAIDDQAANEAAVVAGTLKKVPIGSGFGYVPVGSAGDLFLNNRDAYYAKYPDQKPQAPAQINTTPTGGTATPGPSSSPPNPAQFNGGSIIGSPTDGTSGGAMTTNSTPTQNSSSAPASNQNDLLVAIYQKRPDLQALYNPDGSAKNPNDPRIAGIPTLAAWAGKYGRTEEPTLANFQGPAAFDPTKFGIDQATWNSLSAGDKAFVESLSGVVQSQFDQGQTNVSINQDLLNKALLAAQNDPDIRAKYGDSAKLANAALSFNLSQLTGDWNLAEKQRQQQFTDQQKALSDQIASQGQAYSGFRKQAEQKLADEQSGIVQSSRSQMQKQLQSLGGAYESIFGSAKLPSIGAGGMNYAPIGGVVGSEALNFKNDVLAKQQQIFNSERPA